MDIASALKAKLPHSQAQLFKEKINRLNPDLQKLTGQEDILKKDYESLAQNSPTESLEELEKALSHNRATAQSTEKQRERIESSFNK